MPMRWMCALTIPLLLFGCDEEHKPPSQESVQQAWHRSDQSVQQTEAARAQVRHISRLRDIDRLRYQSETTELDSHLSILRGLLLALALCLLAAFVWLAVEIRRRRVMTGIVLSLGQELEKSDTFDNEDPMNGQTFEHFDLSPNDLAFAD